MSSPPRSRDSAFIAALAVALAIIVFAVTEIPYRYADAHAPDTSRFIGQIAMGDDVASYYSFIYQAAAGHWIFRNNMTYMDHGPAFVNLEWLILGRCMAFFGWSARTTFQVWRAAGALVFFLGFGFLALVALETRRQKTIALFMCAFGGGFGWILYLLSLRGLVDISIKLGLKNPAMDLITPIHAFGQVMKNPHFSLPHGTFLLFVALMILAERYGKPRWYWSAAIVAVVHGFIRPYDLISVWSFFPVFIVLEAALAKSWSIRRSILRALPLILTAPLLLYYVYIFTFHPVFKFWASQGVAPPIPTVWHLRAFGLAGLLCLYRICRFRKYPLVSSGDRLLAVWTGTVLLLFHAGKVLPFMPYSPQLGVPLTTPMILLAVGILLPESSLSPKSWRPGFTVAVAVFLVVNSLSTPIYVIRACQDAVSNKQNFVRTADLKAMQWLTEHVQDSDLIVSDYPTGTKLARLVRARVLLGHWALTPHRLELSDVVDRLLAGKMGQDEAAAFLAEVHADYLYVSPMKGRAERAYFEAIPGVKWVYGDGKVTVYQVDVAKAPPVNR